MPEETKTEERGRSDLLLAVKDANPGSAVDEIVEARVLQMLEERAERRSATAGTPAWLGRARQGDGGGFNAPVGLADRHPYGAVLAAVAAADARNDRAGVLSKWRGKPAEYARWAFGEGSIAARALSSGLQEDGAILIPPDFRGDMMIDLLVESTAVLKMGPVIVPMPRGSVEIPRVTGDVEATYRGEMQEPTLSQPALGVEGLKSRAVDCAVAISNDLISRGGPQIAALVERLMRRRMGITIDTKLLTGTGGVFTPVGLRNHAADTTPATDSTTPTFAQVLGDFGAQISRLEENDVNATKPVFIVAPRVINYAAYQVVTDLGVPYFLDMLSKGSLLGYPYAKTNNIATNLGSGANESYVIFADFDRVYFGQEQDMVMRSSDVASYTEGGVTRSAFMSETTVIVITDKHDLQVEHPEAVDVMSVVKWGA